MSPHNRLMTQSQKLFEEAQRFIPGGVNSPVRAFTGVGGEPVFFKRGKGAYLFDTDGKRYIDYVGSWGPMIVGHAHPSVIKAVQQTAANGLGFGAPTTIETAMAKKICELMPAIEKVRMVNSGTEATMSAIRLARGVTARDKIIKFEGCYHGHVDSLLVKAGSGALTPPENGKMLLDSGADLLVVIQGLFGEPNPEDAAKRYSMLFEYMTPRG